MRDTHSVSITKNVLGQMANDGDAFDFNVRIEKRRTMRCPMRRFTARTPR